MRKSQKKNKKEIFKTKIAWQGWEIPAVDDWRPLEIDGDYKRGKMMIGNSVAPLLQVKWWRPDEKNFYAEEWIRARIREFKATPSMNPPRPKAFSNSGWIKELEFQEDVTKTIWYGFERDAGVMMEIVMTSITDKALQAKIITDLIPELKVYSIEEDTYWSLYDISFHVPKGYILKRKHLYSGDIALEFQDDDKRHLVLRQIYPAELALSRRSMGGWLDNPAFKFKRRFKLESDSEWKTGKANIVDALKRVGKRYIPFPLQWLFPKYVSAIIAKDSELDRLLIAEAFSDEKEFFAEVEKAVLRMNVPSEG